MAPEKDFTRESFFGDRVVCLQPRQGYRYSVDTILLAHFLAAIKDNASILDLGTGCGIIPLILTFRYPTVFCTGIEIQPSMAELARKNIQVNSFAVGRVVIVNDDYCRPAGITTRSFDIVVSNPPFYKIDSSRVSRSSEKAIARHELRATLEDTVRVSAGSVRKGGHVAFVYPPERKEELLAALKKYDLSVNRLQMVHAFPGGGASMFLVDAVLCRAAENISLPPFYIHQERGGTYTESMLSFFKP